MSDAALDVDDLVGGARDAFVSEARPGGLASDRSSTKVQRVVDRLIQALEDLDPTSFFNASPKTDARVLLGILRASPLSPDELQQVLDGLRRRGRIGEFLHLIREDEFRAYLRAKAVPWNYVIQHWAPSAGDSLEFLSGFVVGVGKDSAETLVLVGTVLGAPFDEELANDAKTFWRAIEQLFDVIRKQGIATFVGQQYERMKQEFGDAIYERRFFDAGQMLGQLVAFVVPLLAALPAVAKSVGRLAIASARLIDDLIEVSVRMLRRLDVELQRVYEGFSGALGPQFALSGSISGELAGQGRWMLLTQNGRRFGKVERDGFFAHIAEHRGGSARRGSDPLRDLSDVEIEKYFRGWTTSTRLRRMFGRRFAEEMEGLVLDAQVALYLELDGKWLRPSAYGKRLHEIYRQLAEAFYRDSNFVVRAERRLADFADIPQEIKDMTVRDFMKGRTRGLDPQFLDGKVGDKVPDLVAFGDDTVFVWDLTTKANALHQAKTLFYREVFQRATGKKVEVGETYYRYYAPNADG